jgi:Arginase/agmatinase/formimionoglutamate hydrolase, arginase family
VFTVETCRTIKQSGRRRQIAEAFARDVAMTADNTSRNTPDRMDLPFVGLATFARQPACPDWDKLDGADVAVLGIPIDTASSYRVGTRFGPRAIREVSMFHGFGTEGVFDFEDEVTYLTPAEVKIVDAGDSDVIYADTKRSLANAEQAVRALLDAKTMPYILGGDHAITMATVAAFSNEKPIHIVHLDAHFDFIDERDGITWGHGSPMRRASEMPHVKGITTLGPHNMASVSRKDWERREGLWHARRSLAQAPGRAPPLRLRTSPMANESTSRSTSTASIRRLHREQPRSATAASATTKARRSCARLPGGSRSSAPTL